MASPPGLIVTVPLDAPADKFCGFTTTDAVDGVMLVDSMRAGGELQGIRTLAFYSHVEADTRAKAQRAGFDQVVPRSRMAREGAALVDRLLT